MQSHLGEEEVGFWSEAEKGGKEGWFVGRPLMMDEADVSVSFGLLFPMSSRQRLLGLYRAGSIQSEKDAEADTLLQRYISRG